MLDMGDAAMATIQELRRKQEAQVDALRKLQWNKAASPMEGKEMIQREIDSIENDIRNLDTIIAALIKS